jgi:hypothetical protein
MRIKIANSFLLLTFLFSISLSGYGQTSKPAKDLPIDEIIKRFTAAETENKAARLNYVFTQDFDVMTLGEAGSITGRYHRVSDIVLDNKGNRSEKITLFPPSTLAVTMTKEDMEDLAGAQSFGLTQEDLPKYQITYVNKERIDEINAYVFEVKPKKFVKGERYFDGRIWVDDQDLQIVKAVGKAVPEVDKQKFPRFESYRENIDGKYWFPTYVYVDDILDFKTGDVHLRGSVKFKNYKKFSTGIRVADDDPGEAAGDGVTKPDPDKKPDTEPATDAKKPNAPPVTDTKKPDAKTETKKPVTPPVTKKPNLQ